MNLNHTLSTTLLLASLASAIPTAQAKTPLLSSEESSALESSYQHFSTLSQSQIEKYLSLENHKGEVNYFRKSESFQINEPDLWATLDPKEDLVEGTSTEKAYRKFPPSMDPRRTIIVAVIDGGVDIQHEDLKGKIWVNPGELGHDEDHDGYLNDVNGWNFLGDLLVSNLEVTREYGRLTRIASTRALTAREQTYFNQIKTTFLKEKNDTQEALILYQSYAPNLAILKAAGLTDESLSALNELDDSDPNVAKAKEIIRPFFRKNQDTEVVEAMIEKNKHLLNVLYNEKLNTSATIGDHPDQLEEIGYGSNDVRGPNARHGTHVAGIIAANRLNGIGILGQAQNVKIMPLRAVPSEGDERDKDVGNAIRYAVDHGARIINMSFGKNFSPFQDYVRQQAAYAASKGVLIVHAAGNEGMSLDDGHQSFPNKKSVEPSTLDYWLEVGAADRDNMNQRLAAKFSNFGKFMVDLFAPGVSIVSTIPQNLYASLQGTSMAAPEVSGVAALLMSQFPNADAKIVRKAILDSVNRYPGVQVIKPNKTMTSALELVDFASLSASGGTVNALQAMNRLYDLTHNLH